MNDFHEIFPGNPEKEMITEEMHLEKEWFEQARKVKTVEELTAFVNHLLNDYNHDYGTVCHAIGACASAAAWLGAEIEGITGYQAGFIMWDFILNWTKWGNKCGLKIVDYDDFLYPQYENKYDKTISRESWKKIQEQAKKRLEENPYAAENVIWHWKNIAAGVIPFGYRVEDD